MAPHLDFRQVGGYFLGRPRQDSNLRHRLRRAVLYPLSYEGKGIDRSAVVHRADTAAGRPRGAR
jgi:hypothetical protein